MKQGYESRYLTAAEVSSIKVGVVSIVGGSSLAFSPDFCSNYLCVSDLIWQMSSR